MNWEHLRAFLWLHSRINANKAKRSASASNILQSVLRVIAIIIAVGSFAGGLALGFIVLKQVRPAIILYVWAGIVGAFLFGWLLMLSIDLQRSELLPLEKFMHYPVSVSGLFLINYLASILSEYVSLCLFFPAMLGISVGLTLARGVGMIWLFPLFAAFLLMVTGVTYQFRGWLAVLMMNKRHRRTVISVVTIVSILIFQLPGLSRFAFPRRSRSAPVISMSKPGKLVEQISMIVPVGWLPYGAMAAADGRVLPPFLCIAGMTLIGAFSLRRSYRTTVRLYTGNYGSGKTRRLSLADLPKMPAAPAPAVTNSRSTAGTLMETVIPGVSQQAAVIGLATFRSLTRAPEVKMLLVSPVILGVMFGAPMLRMASHPTQWTLPLLSTGAVSMVLLSIGSLALNQFAYDRSGFRNYVLASARRRDILLGKNLALLPVIMGISGILVLLLQWFFPMRIDHFLAVICQMTTMCLLFFLYANVVSILNPTATTAGSFRPAVRPTFKSFMFGFLSLIAFPFALAPALIPLAIEVISHALGWYPAVPVFFLLSLVEVIGVIFLYSELLNREGRLLQSRELKILDVVTARVAEG